MTGEVDDDIDLNLFSSLVKLDHVTSKSGESISIKHFYLGRVGRVAEPPAAVAVKELVLVACQARSRDLDPR